MKQKLLCFLFLAATLLSLGNMQAAKNNKQAQLKRTPTELVEYAKGYAATMVDEYDGVSSEPEDISVYAEATPDGCNIVGTGEDIFFVEFGTGLFYSRSPIPHPYNVPASWSATHAQYLTDPQKLSKYHGYWPYKGKWTSGQPAANVFYEAGKNVGHDATSHLKDFMNEVIV